MYTIFSDETEQNLITVMQKFSMELVTDPGRMLEILAESKTNGTAVGIYAPVVSRELFVTAVEDIIIDEDVTIVLKNYDITGYMLETNKVKFDDIRSVCPFTSPFRNPYMRTLKQSKPT